MLTPEQYAQEYECSFEAAVVGAYYGRAMQEAETAKRVCGVPYDPAARVWTAWDLGFRDATAVWFAQVVGREIHLIDYYEAVGTDIAEDVRAILAKPYNFAGHIVPHDAYATAKQTGTTTAQRMGALGTARHHAIAAITASRMEFRQCNCCCRAAGSTARNACAALMR
jgi:phage terminase large subunit